MKSNRMFYIGLGCLFSTLCWTITALVEPENQPSEQNLDALYNKEMKALKVERLICSELSIVDENGKEVMVMLNQHPADPSRGPVFSIQDMRHREDGKESMAHLALYRDGLVLYNVNNHSIIGLKNATEGGLLWAKNADRKLTWFIDANSRRPFPINPKPTPKKTNPKSPH